VEELGDFIGYYYCDDVVDDIDCSFDTIEKENSMLPIIEEAKKELEIAGELNPGPWTAHSVNVGIAARNIARKVPGMDVVAFPADETMVEYAVSAAEMVNPGHVKIGRVATGDQFICDKEAKNAIIENTQALCTEMEGGAIAQAAYRNEIPFVIIRAISDKADDSAEMDYPTFEAIAAHRCATVVQTMSKQLKNV
jgi:5'-methylthioadenosine/S-adenosylhomocysteine nucleosidase